MNANWTPGAEGEDGTFELMIVTTDDRQHFVTPSPAAVTALIALAQAGTVLVWDPADRTLIAANLRGTMPWTEAPATSAPETALQRAKEHSQGATVLTSRIGSRRRGC